MLEDPTIPDAVKQVVEAIAEASGITLGPTDDDMEWARLAVMMKGGDVR